MKLKNVITLKLLIGVLFTLNIFAQEKITDQKIIGNFYYRHTGDDSTSDLTMTLINSRGLERVREIKQRSKDYGKEEKSIMFFFSPADLRNTSFINRSYDEESRDDDQWIYLPALKKVKRILSDSKSDYFTGSDFTYDDLGYSHLTEDNHKLLLPDQNSFWSLQPDYPLPNSMNYANTEVRDKLSDSEIFAKYLLLSSAIDFELMAAYSWDDDPAYHSQKILNQTTGVVDAVVLKPEYHRLTTLGGSFSITPGPLVLRGEDAYYTGKYFQSMNPTLSQCVIEKDYFHYLLGVDYNISNLKLSS